MHLLLLIRILFKKVRAYQPVGKTDFFYKLLLLIFAKILSYCSTITPDVIFIIATVMFNDV